MWTLGIDTSASAVSAAILKDGAIAASYNKESSSGHSSALLPAVSSLLCELSLAVSEIDLVSCAVGPGSFTGVRIGVATAKGLSSPDSIPCVGVSSLEALAYPLGSTSSFICPVIGARRGNVYSALFRGNGDGTATRLTDDALIAICELPALCRCHLNLSDIVYTVGDASDVVCGVLENDGIKALAAKDGEFAGSGAGAAMAGRMSYLKHPAADYSPSLLRPIYLRKSQAERELEERLGRRENT